MAGEVSETLRTRGIQPSAQRVAIAEYVLSTDCHPSADQVWTRVRERLPQVSRATVYNTLHQFTEAGLLREVSVDAARTYFDTNTSDHHHFFVEDENRLIDVKGEIEVGAIPPAPDGMEVTSVDIVIKVRRTPG